MQFRKLRFDLRQAGKQALVLYSIVLALNVLFYALVVRPRALEYRRLSTASEPQVKKLQEREKFVRGREEYLAALSRAQSELDRLRKDVLSTRERRMIEVQQELSRLATEFNINLQQVRYVNELLPDEGMERFAMVVPLEGGYANLRKFIQSVEDSDKFLVIEQVALGTGKEGGVMLQLNITLATYFDDPELRKLGVPGRRPSPARA